MLYQEDEEERSGLAQAGRARQHRFGGRWGRRSSGLGHWPKPGQRAAPALFKITSYAHSGEAVWDRVNYISRDGEREIEGPNGERLESLAEIADVAAAWVEGTEDRRRRVLAMSAVVSFSAGIDQEKATETARQFLRAAFADNYDYVFAPHSDTANFHVHAVVRAAGHDGRQLRIGRADIQRLRELLAEQGAALGIELDASPRRARGLEAERGRSREVEGMLRRGATPSPARQAALKSELARDAVAEEQARPARAAGAALGQALVYARACGRIASRLPEWEDDSKKGAAIQAAAALGAVGLEMAHQDGGQKAAERARAQEIVWRAQRVLHENIRFIEAGEAKREAIQADRSLSRDLAEYREERKQRAAAARREKAAERAAERGKGLEWEW